LQHIEPYKFAIKHHLPDLAGKLMTTNVDKESILLLKSLSDDELIKVIGIAVTQMSLAEDHIANMFNITVADLEEDDHIWQLAEDFY